MSKTGKIIVRKEMVPLWKWTCPVCGKECESIRKPVSALFCTHKKCANVAWSRQWSFEEEKLW